MSIRYALRVKDRPLNATAASLLGFLHRGPMTGWELVRTAEQSIGDFWSLTQSQVYRELAQMAEHGLVTAGERGPRERRPYELTEAGRAAFSGWALLPPGEETIRFPLLLALSFGEHIPADRMAAFVRHHRAIHEARLTQYELDAQPVIEEPYRQATLDFGLAYERAVLGWFDRLPAEIAGKGANQPI
jgi:DNA-binding PadR family transcriptional regulator